MITKDEKGQFENNAMLLKPDGTASVVTLKTSTQINDLLGCCAVSEVGEEKARQYGETMKQMIRFFQYPVDLGGANDETAKNLAITFVQETVKRGKSLPPLKHTEEYDYHRIAEIENIQIFINEVGQWLELPPNRWFSGYLRGAVIVLGHCIDEMPYQ